MASRPRRTVTSAPLSRRPFGSGADGTNHTDSAAYRLAFDRLFPHGFAIDQWPPRNEPMEAMWEAALDAVVARLGLSSDPDRREWADEHGWPTPRQMIDELRVKR
jgi:hypothetical protein